MLQKGNFRAFAQRVVGGKMTRKGDGGEWGEGELVLLHDTPNFFFFPAIS
jgi:hypothetical protein